MEFLRGRFSGKQGERERQGERAGGSDRLRKEGRKDCGKRPLE